MSLALSLVRAVSLSSKLIDSNKFNSSSPTSAPCGVAFSGVRGGRNRVLGSWTGFLQSPRNCPRRSVVLPANAARITLSSLRSCPLEEYGASFGSGEGGSRCWRLWGQRTKEKSLGKGKRRNVVAVKSSLSDTAQLIMDGIKWGWNLDPPTWNAAFISIGTIFVVAAPVLWVGLTLPGMLSAYILGSLIWRAYGGQGLLTICLFYIMATAATKLKLKEKQKEGIAEQRSGRRGPGSVWGSGTAGALCALLTIFGVGGPEIAPLWHLGYLASLCTKLSDTISSEIGKAFGKTTYLVTSFSIVPRGTEGAVSVEGTLAGLFAAVFLAATSYTLNQIDATGAVVAVLASQVANLLESYLGATLQGRAGFEWLSNDLVNVANITIGATFAIFAQKLLIG